MVRRKRSVIVVVICACVMLIDFAASGYCQKPPDTPQEPVVQLQPSDQQPPVSLRKLRLGLEIVADLNVDPPTYTGSCPGLFTFTGRIYVNKPITIQYRFVGRGLPPSLSKSLTFDSPGRKEVSEVRQLGDANTMPTFGGSVILQVVWPAKAESNIVSFSGSCTDRGQPTPRESSSQQTMKEIQQGPRATSGVQQLPQGPAAVGSPMFPTGPQGPLGPGAMPLPESDPRGEQVQGALSLPEMNPQGSVPADMSGPAMAPKATRPEAFPLLPIGPDGQPVK